MAIDFFNEEIDLPDLDFTLISKWIDNVVSQEDMILGDISFIFSDDDYLLRVNQQYLNHDYFTDVITFDYCDDKLISGDIFISLERVKENASEFNVDYNNEILRVVIHGILHLIGYNDKTVDLKNLMTKAENDALDLYKTFS